MQEVILKRGKLGSVDACAQVGLCEGELDELFEDTDPQVIGIIGIVACILGARSSRSR